MAHNQFQKILLKPWFFCALLGFIVFSYFFLDRQVATFFHVNARYWLGFTSQTFTRFGISTSYIIITSVGFMLAFFIFKNKSVANKFFIYSFYHYYFWSCLRFNQSDCQSSSAQIFLFTSFLWFLFF